jgi:hypothetical protein
LDLGRYKKYRQKGRISPRATSSIGTSSLTTSPMSTSSSFFASAASTPQQKSLCGVAITEYGHKYKIGPIVESAASEVEETPLGESPLSKYIDNAQTTSQSRIMRHYPPQSKEERRRKLKKWEKFRRAQKPSEEVAKKAVANNVPSRLPPKQVATTLLPTTSMLSSESYGSIPKRITVTESRNESKENLPTSTATRRQPMDPPRTTSIKTHRTKRTEDPPTHRSPSPASPPHPQGFSPVAPPTMEQLRTQVLNRYDRIIKVESRQDTPTTTTSSYLKSVATLSDDGREGSSAQHPIRLDELDVSHMDVSAPIRSRNNSEPPQSRGSDQIMPTVSIDGAGFDFSFSPKFQPAARSTRTPSPTIRFDFTPSNAATKQQPRPKSTTANRMTSTTSFDFASPTIRSKQQARTDSGSHTTMTPPLPTTQHQMSAFRPPASAYNIHHTPPIRTNSRPPPRSTGMTTTTSRIARADSTRSTPQSEPRRQNRSNVHRQLQSSSSLSTTSTERRDRLMESRDESDSRDTFHENDIRMNHPVSPYSYRQTPSRNSFEVPSIGSESLANDFDMESSQHDHAKTTESGGLDQRTARMLFSKGFSQMIQQQKMRDKLLSRGKEREKKLLKCGGNGVTFVVRKRPISQNETNHGEYDVVNADTGHPGGIVVYKTKVLPDLQTKDLTSRSFRCNQVVSEHQSTDEFYMRVAEPLVDVAKKGGFASIVMCGSSGSGKTQTMADIEEWAVNDIFESKMASRRSVSLQYVEVSEKNCYDLLSPGSFVHVVNKEAGYFQLEGAKTVTASNTSDLLRLFSNARRRLAMRGNVRKKSDGNSFVLCQMTIQEGGRRQRGCLTMLECPSDEINHIWIPSVDTTKTTSSFDALMQCISAKITQRTITNPFRNFNNLTKLMKQSMETKESRVCVLVTVSPIASDTESTLTALSSVGNVMRGYKPRQRSHGLDRSSSSYGDNSTGEDELVLPRQWSHKELFSWMRKKNLRGVSAPANINGRLAMRMSKKQLRDTFYGMLDDDKASKLYVALRAENDRVARLRVKRRMSMSQK